MNLLILDNYDSFTYNLVQMVEDILGREVNVIKNDEIALKDLEQFDKIILSPGPGIPQEAGRLLEVIKNYENRIPILGVCLGHQAIAEAFGANLKQLDSVKHGVFSQILETDDENLFRNIDLPLQVGRYHSWVVDEVDFPTDLKITSKDEFGNIMSLKHENYPISGVQFHPESILTPQGKLILKNWLSL
ncbi:aminodeoxychorismate/anthranilate synthase component II [Weeksellaceae bacterium KMM 9713]|uniref:Aminodeoxychorismate/anthranilate synthase component II n=1 Tax=Profundicola chukchiensis TaxID=2961959 RepID=A0A9X4MX31_9FLAO|nr:aminodeoxychorismate/anthranilate synthase component II [Profundicola chukchiensis]MDG4946476.1 aminodeoxychorismate/anthranilate synthase component II [Profundicola chukchiensis]